MNAIKMIAMTALLGMLSGCQGGRVLMTVNGEPGAADRLRQKTISTQIAKDANIMTKQVERSVQIELKQSGFKWVPTGGQVTMLVAMGHGGYGTGKTATFGPVFSPLGGWETYQEKTDILELDLSASEQGAPFWEARIGGSGEYLNGDDQRGCIRELLDRIDENGTEETRCD